MRLFKFCTECGVRTLKNWVINVAGVIISAIVIYILMR